MANTKGEGKSGDDFWQKAEVLLYTALIGFIHYELPPEERNFATLIEMISSMEVREDNEAVSYTHLASALSFMLENLSKPVILTGSQLPIGMLRTDGKENLDVYKRQTVTILLTTSVPWAKPPVP